MHIPTLIAQCAALAAVVVIPMTFALRRLRVKPDGRSLGITFVTLGLTMFVAVPITIWLVFREMR